MSKQEVHPLQKLAAGLLDKARDLSPVSRAQITYSRGYYPGINEILAFLDTHKEEQFIADFVKKHKSLIVEAMRTVEEKERAPKHDSSYSENEEAEEEVLNFFNYTAPPDLAKAIKLASLNEIEERIASIFSELLVEDVTVLAEMQNIDFGSDVSTVRLNLVVKAKDPKDPFML